MATLECFGPGGHGLIALDEERGQLTIGTRAGNDLVLDKDGSVSRVHARFENLGAAWSVTDLKSTNGTMVNGVRTDGITALTHLDEILVGRTRLIIHDRRLGTERTTEPLRQPPRLTPVEGKVLIELCRPVLSGTILTDAATVRTIAGRLYVGEGAVRQHLGHLYDKFGIGGEPGERRIRLANDAIQTGAVTMGDLRDD